MHNFKGANLFGGDFPSWYLELEISGLKPDFVSNFPGFEVEKGLFLHVLLGEFVGSFGFLLCILNLIELLLESWKEGSSEGWIRSEFISYN